MAPHIVELMAAAGAGHALVGRVASANYPAFATSLPSVGDGLALNVEALLALQPDIVLAWQAAPLRHLAPVWRAQNIQVTYSDPLTLDAIADGVAAMGERFGTSDVAAPEAARLRTMLATLRARYREALPLRVFVQLGTGPVYSLGAQSIVTDVLRTCGAQNVMAASSLAAPLMSAEGVLATFPDAVLTGGDTREANRVQAWWYARGWTPAEASLTAHTPDRRIIALPADVLWRPAPRLIDALPELCARIDRLRPASHRRETPAS